MGGDNLKIKRAKKNPLWKTPEQIQREMADIANPKWEDEVERVGDAQKQMVKDSNGNYVLVHTAMSQFLVDQAKKNGPPVFKFQAKEAAEKARKAQEKANIEKGKENEKTTVATQKEVATTTTSRAQHRSLIKSIRDRNREDLETHSAVRGTFRTPGQQAIEEPNFIGKSQDAFYFILDEASYYNKLIPGEYVIIYTRPVGEKFGDTPRSALIDPNTTGGNTIEIFRNVDQARAHGSEPLVSFIGQLMRDKRRETGPYNCAGQIKSGGRITHFAVRAPDEAQVKPYRASVDLHTYPVISDEKHTKSPLDARFHESIRPSGTTVSFGYKEMCGDKDLLRNCWTSHGFQFIEMEIATISEGKNERQLVVGVKLPSGRDISSAFILKQLVPYNTQLHKIAMMYQEELDCVWQGDMVHEFDDKSGDAQVGQGNQEGKMSHGFWRLPSFSALGLSNVDLDMFNASTFETYILHRDDTVYGLETILAIMNKWLKDASDSQGRNGLREAREYAKHRTIVAKRERAIMHGQPFPEDEDADAIDIENIPGVDFTGRA